MALDQTALRKAADALADAWSGRFRDYIAAEDPPEMSQHCRMIGAKATITAYLSSLTPPEDVAEIMARALDPEAWALRDRHDMEEDQCRETKITSRDIIRTLTAAGYQITRENGK